MPEPDDPSFGAMPLRPARGGPVLVGHGIDPMRHLARTAAATEPVVVIMGDSISREMPVIALDGADSFWGHLRRAFRSANPGVPFAFHNRAIGGTSWHTANPAAPLSAGVTALPDWAGDGARPWIDIVGELAPDCLILAFGMNDSVNYWSLRMLEVLARVGTWAKVPDIVMVTPMLPSRSLPATHRRHAGISAPAAQDGRLFAGHHLRSHALRAGLGLLDLQRVQCQLVQGFDPRETSFRADPVAVARRLPHTAPGTDQDLGIEIAVDDRLLPPGGRELWITASARGDRQNGSRVAIRNDRGRLAVAVQDFDADAGRYLSMVTGVAVPDVPAPLRLVLKDGFLYLALRDAGIVETPIRRGGGRFAPVVGMSDGSRPEVPLRILTATFRPTVPVLDDAAMWGDPEGSGRTTGGNGVNHPTSLGGSHVYRVLLDATDLRLPRPGG